MLYKDIYYNSNFGTYAPAKIESITPLHIEDHPIIRLNGFPYSLYLKTLNGCGRVTIDNHSFFLEKHQALIISSNFPYKYEPIGNEPWETCFFSYSGDLVQVIERMLDFSDYIVLNEDFDSFTVDMIKSWYSLIMNQADLINYYEISVQILSFFSTLYTELSRETNKDSFAYLNYIKPTREYIHQNYDKKILISDLAERVNISHQHLTKIFHLYLGSSPKQYLCDYRIFKAKTILIESPSESISDIAYAVGFSTTSQFIETFKKLIGDTPKKYRSKYISNLH